MHFFFMWLLEVVLFFVAEVVCGWLGSWFLYIISLGRWNLPDDSLRASFTGAFLLIGLISLIVWWW